MEIEKVATTETVALSERVRGEWRMENGEWRVESGELKASILFKKVANFQLSTFNRSMILLSARSSVPSKCFIILVLKAR